MALKLLVSLSSMQEAQSIVDLCVDIVDIKNPGEGALGAQPPWVIGQIAQYLATRGVAVSATLGDLPYQPGTAALAASGAARFGLSYVKAGLYGAVHFKEAHALITAVRKAVDLVRPETQVVAAGYGDYRRFGGLHPSDLVHAAAVAGAQVVMLDTAIKDGSSLLDVMNESEVESFVGAGRQANLKIALAGSLALRHLPMLGALGPDILGVRGALCSKNDRSKGIDRAKAREFVAAVHGT